MRENVLMTGSTGFIGSHVNILGMTIGQSLLRLWVKKGGQTTLYSRETSQNSSSS